MVKKKKNYTFSADDDYGQKTVSVLLDGQETDLEIVDHPACEMSVRIFLTYFETARRVVNNIIMGCFLFRDLQTEAFCSTYNIDQFVVVYSVVDRKSFKFAERVLHYLRDSEMLLTRGAILVGNKTDLERHREVPRSGMFDSIFFQLILFSKQNYFYLFNCSFEWTFLY